MLKKLLEWDQSAFIYLNGLGLEPYDVFWSTITNVYHWIPLYVLFAGLLLAKFPRREAGFKLLTLLGLVVFVLGLTYCTKLAVARLRPNNTEEINTLIRILHFPTDYSFFSGHAAVSFSITILVFLFLREKVKWIFLFFLWPVLFALSRIYVGVHFPLDILVGAVVGSLSGFWFYGLHHRFILPYTTLNHPEQEE